ncbi:hypothetical protein JHK85_028488 [Glycine max]|nr:hypothetical protein JHK85_028488 [Glycine max]
MPTNNGPWTKLGYDNHLVTQTGSKTQQLIVNGKSDYESRSVRYSFPPVSVEPSIAPHPKSYMEVNCCLAVHIPPLRHPSMHTPTTFFRHEATSECLLYFV